MLETLDFQKTWISHVRDVPSRFSLWERSQLRAIGGSQGGVGHRPVDSGLPMYETITGREVSLEDYAVENISTAKISNGSIWRLP